MNDGEGRMGIINLRVFICKRGNVKLYEEEEGGIGGRDLWMHSGCG